MELLHLKIATCLYSQLTKYDASYNKLVKRYPKLNLKDNEQITALIEWLRDWGCRQFKKDNTFTPNEGNESILEWQEKYEQRIPNFEINLLDFDLNRNKELIIDIFNDLSERKASTRNNGVNVRIGPVGTAKTLFALRPILFAPWDTYIYSSKKYKLKGDGSSYYTYLSEVKKELIEIINLFESTKRECDNLFEYLKRPHKSYPKLIDEYNWITITKGCILSDIIECL